MHLCQIQFMNTSVLLTFKDFVHLYGILISRLDMLDGADDYPLWVVITYYNNYLENPIDLFTTAANLNLFF